MRSVQTFMLAPFFWRSGAICYRAHTNSPYRSFQTGSSRPRHRWFVYSTSTVVLAMAGIIAFGTSQPFRHTVYAVERCSRIAGAAILGAVDYKWTFAQKYASDEEQEQAYSLCHKRSALRVRHALLANGGVFIKMGQHMASLYMLPKEWTSTMKPLQDQCISTPYEEIEILLLQDMGTPVSEIFEELDQNPIGVASLAQVHVGRLKNSRQWVAVKLQHPHLAEFCDIDMKMVEVTLGWIKYWFPEFEFTWLGEEMRTNLPKEMDFVHEANNAAKVDRDFQHISTSLYIPKVIEARKRVLIMEYIRGGRVDDLAYLASNNIDRNKVALELSRIFSQMVFINGWFHADPHPGNLLIRPASPNSKSPYNFEVVLLDHGLYFDIDPSLRVNYSKFWLSLIAPATPSTLAERRKYAKLVGNITSDLYPIFESAITGRVGLEGTWDDDDENATVKRASSMINIAPQTEQEMDVMRETVISREGLLLSVFDVLRRVPRRVLMVLKLNDLTRGLDHALATTHSNIRVFLITAKSCAYSVWQNERRRLYDDFRYRGMSFRLLKNYFICWWTYEMIYVRMTMLETAMDIQALVIKLTAWCRGLYKRGISGAHRAASGLDY